MEEKKKITLYILQLLKEYSDENHPLSTNTIIELMQTKYNMSIERRTVYRTVDTLNELGYTIRTWKETGSGYYLTNREFDEGEVILLCNAIHSSNFLSDKQSSELVNKILKTQSRYQSKLYVDSVYRHNIKKTSGDSLIKALKVISYAISENKCISFSYTHYNSKKQKVSTDTSTRILEPRYIVYNEEKPYLVATIPNTVNIRHYRIDRMDKVKIYNQKMSSLSNKKDAYEYAKNKYFMFSDEEIPVKFHCSKNSLDIVIDFFGTNIMLIEDEEKNGYYFTVTGSKKGLRLFAQRNIDCIDIVSPESLKEEMRTILETALQKYK